MIYVIAIVLIITGIAMIMFACSNKSDKHNGIVIGNTSLIMYLILAGLILFIIGGMMLNGILGVYICH